MVKRSKTFQGQEMVSDRQRTQDTWVKMMSFREMGVSEFRHATDARQRVGEAVASFQSTPPSSEDAVMDRLSQG